MSKASEIARLKERIAASEHRQARYVRSAQRHHDLGRKASAKANAAGRNAYTLIHQLLSLEQDARDAG